MRRIWVSALLGLMVACGGGGGGSSGAASNPVIVDGVAAKGPLSFATLDFWVLNADGSLGDHLGSALTFSRGQFDFLSLAPTPTGYVYVASSGGSYVDEATGARVDLGSAEGLCAVMRDEPAAINLLAVTPLTTIAAKRIRALAAAGTPLALAYDSCIAGVSQQYGLQEIVEVFPADPTDAAATRVASIHQRRYGLVLAGIAELADRMGMRAIDLALSMAADAEDGAIDAKLTDGRTPLLHLLPDLQDAIDAIAGRTMGNHNLAGHAIATRPVQIGVASAGVLRFTTHALPAWTSGEGGSAGVGVAGGVGPLTYELDGTLPFDFQWNGQTTFTGQRTLGAGSTHFISAPFTLRVRDSAVPPAEIELELVIQVTSPPPSIDCLALPPATEGVSYSEPVATMTGAHGPFHFSLDTLRNGAPPFGLTVEPVGQPPNGTVGFLAGTPGTGTGGRTYSFGVCGVDRIGNPACCQATLVVQSGGGGGGGGCDGTYVGTFSATSPIGPSSGSITIRVLNGVADTVPPGASFGGNVDASCNLVGGFWNNCPGAGCANFPVTGAFQASGQFQLTGQNGSGSETVVLTLNRQ